MKLQPVLVLASVCVVIIVISLFVSTIKTDIKAQNIYQATDAIIIKIIDNTGMSYPYNKITVVQDSHGHTAMLCGKQGKINAHTLVFCNGTIIRD